MQADWEFEIGGDAPLIEADWSGFVDLRLQPEEASRLQEAIRFPPLAKVLCLLNGAKSPVWTSKCDVFADLAPEEFDADELDSVPGNASFGMGCYIDLLPRSQKRWQIPAMAEAGCKSLCARIQKVPLPCCRVDLVIRRAQITPDAIDLGITAFITACGPTSDAAAAVLEKALAVFADSVEAASISPPSATQLQ